MKHSDKLVQAISEVVKAGTSDGAKKGWEKRKRGGSGPAVATSNLRKTDARQMLGSVRQKIMTFSDPARRRNALADLRDFSIDLSPETPFDAEEFSRAFDTLKRVYDIR